MPDAIAPPPDQPRLEDFICFAVYAAGHAFNRVYKPLLDPLGLTYPQYLVMVALWQKDDQTVGSLGEALSLESSTLTPLLKRLEAMGRISRARDKADERQVRVSLTAEGRALRDSAAGVPACILAATGLDVAGLTALQKQITALTAALQKPPAKP